MLKLEFYPFMHGIQMHAVGIDKALNPDGSKKDGESCWREISTASIEQLGLAGAIASALWALHQDYPAIHEYARR